MTDAKLPPEFTEFGDRLEAAAAAEIEAERRRRPPRARPLLVAVAAALLAGGAVAGASALFGDDGPPLPHDRSGSAGATSSPDPAVVAGTAVAEPLGGPGWGVRVFADRRGRDCVAAGRLSNGRIGVVVDGRFRAQRDIAPGICGNLARDGVLAVAEGRAQPAPRILVYGLSSSRMPISIVAGRRTRRVRPAALGAFLVVLPGSLTDGPVRLATTVDGRPFRTQLGLGRGGGS